ncbi:hypothetical protein FNV43_RR18591 [Rhamnella rubrinervis]|uniref:Uncharacterized protein n=1 Tax=Rhamnella rubrinervis TaxID=2594499 RepID=A0A8K0GT28_9ROSA|nr:hypothetical protein FNV43_RR18591 [Rhamnella rubrinervis]
MYDMINNNRFGWNAIRHCVKVDSDKAWTAYVQDRATEIGVETLTGIVEDLNLDSEQEHNTNFGNTDINSPMSVNQPDTSDATLLTPTQSSGMKRLQAKEDITKRFGEVAFMFKKLAEKFERNDTNYPEYLVEELDRLGFSVMDNLKSNEK